MAWTKPDFEEIALSMEVTAYVNTDDQLPLPAGGDGDQLTAGRPAVDGPAEG
jgi:coenzyme PQQ precursor peptide PqqA